MPALLHPGNVEKRGNGSSLNFVSQLYLSVVFFYATCGRY